MIRKTPPHLYVVKTAKCPHASEPLKLRMIDGQIKSMPRTSRAIAVDFLQFFAALLPENQVELLVDIANTMARTREDDIDGADYSVARRLLAQLEDLAHAASAAHASAAEIKRVRVK